MTKKQLWINLLSISIIPITIMSVTYFPSPLLPLLTLLQSTTFWWTIKVLILVAFMYASHAFFDTRNTQALKVVKWYLVWNAINCFRGFFVAEYYWDTKGLVGNTMALMLPIVAYAATNKMLVQSILSRYVKYALPLFIVFVFLVNSDAHGFYLVPVSVLMIFFPALTTRWRWMVVGFTLFVLFINLDARSNVIKFLVPVALLGFYYLRRSLTVRLLEVVRLHLIIVPIVLFALAVSGIFNIFRMDEYIGGTHEVVKMDLEGEMVEYNLKSDTRTFLYTEVLYTAQVYNFWWIGRSPARGNISEAFGEGDETGRGERLANEVAVLNIFTWTGIIGVILYLFIFYKASYLAVNESNNIYSKMLGLMVGFRWMYSWVEDVNEFQLNYFMLWLMIGLCFSKSFRDMTDKEVKVWVHGIFDFRRRKASSINKALIRETAETPPAVAYAGEEKIVLGPGEK